MENKLLKLLTTSTITVALILTGCGAIQDSDPQSTNKALSKDTTTKESSIKIGAILPLTGDKAAYGISMQIVTQIAIDKINQNGGFKGTDIEFIFEDGKCNEKDAATAAQKLIKIDKVEVIHGGFCSSETLAAAAIAEEAGVLILSSGSSSPEITTAGDYIFRNYPSDASQGIILGNIASEMGLKKAGIITEENEITLSIDSAFRSTFETNGGQVISTNYLPNETNLLPQITKLKDEGVNLIFINSQTPAKTDVILKQIQDLEIDTQLFANNIVLGWTEGLERYSDLVEGMIGTEIHFEKDHPDFIALTAEYKNRSGKDQLDFPTYAATFYDAVFLIKDGLDKNGNKADRLKDFLYNIHEWEGLSGSLTIDENGDPKNGHKAKIIKDGKTELR